MDMKEGFSIRMSGFTLLTMLGAAFGIFYRLKFTTEQLKTTNDLQNERIDQVSRSAQKANDGVSEIKTEMLHDAHKNEENFARLEAKLETHGAKLSDVAIAIKEQAANRDDKLDKIYLAISSRNGGPKDV